MVLAATAQDCNALQHAGVELRGDREVVLAAVAQNGTALLDATAELLGDREVVLAAVAQDGRALQYAAAELRPDAFLVKMSSFCPRLSPQLCSLRNCGSTSPTPATRGSAPPTRACSGRAYH